MKKIMFDDRYRLTWATLNGIKTCTRRIEFNKDEQAKLAMMETLGFKPFVNENHVVVSNAIGGVAFAKPTRFKVGEVVAIAQSYEEVFGRVGRDLSLMDKPGFTNKMFVSADLMPEHIKITGIRCERLQDISDEDCLREGVIKSTWYHVEGLRPKDCEKESNVTTVTGTWKLFPDPREAYAALIDKISGKGTWESNPFVVVYDYKKL